MFGTRPGSAGMHPVEVAAVVACFLFGLGCFVIEWIIRAKGLRNEFTDHDRA